MTTRSAKNQSKARRPAEPKSRREGKKAIRTGKDSGSVPKPPESEFRRVRWTPEKKRKLLNRLEKLYPEPASELNFKNTYQLLVAVVLSAQCTDKKVNEVTPSLFAEYPSFAKLGAAELTRVEALIRPINYYKTKSKNLLALGEAVTEQFKGRVPRNFDDLTSLPGVGRKTANVVLSELGAEPSFPVDTHVFRVARRLGLSSGKNVLQVEEDLRNHFEPETWRNLHHWLIFHGRRVCKAQRPECERCALADICPSAGLFSSKK